MSNKITITTKHGTWTTTEADIKAATWKRESNMERRTICPMADIYNSPDWREGHSLTIHREGDECDWSGIVSDNLKATDAEGREVILHLSASEIWDEDGRSSYIAYPADRNEPTPENCKYWNDEADIKRGDWDEPLHANDWLDIAGLPSEGAPSTDYAEAAADWMTENCDEKTRYWMDDCRGFANEWILYIDPHGRDVLTAGDLNGDCNPDPAEGLSELSRETVAHYIADAVMSREDYEREHLAESCVRAIMLD